MARDPSSDIHVAFLRGINVGGKNILPMKALAEMFVAAGATDVETYVQSGNVVCRARSAVAKKLPTLIHDAIMKRFGYAIPVVMRSRDELRAVVRANPFLAIGADPKKLHVAFLRDAPGASRLAKLDAKRSPGDAFIARGRDLYLRLPSGVAKTKLTNAYLDSTLATISTVRNWRTVLALAERCDG